MFDDYLTDANIERALNYIELKKVYSGYDGMTNKQFREYFNANKEIIIQELYTSAYKPDLIQEVDILNFKKKKRTIAKLTVKDCFVLRLILQVISDDFNNAFSRYSFAFRPEYGTQKAVEALKGIVNEGYKYIISIDIKNCYDCVNHSILLSLLENYGLDSKTIQLLELFLKCSIISNSKIRKKEIGIVQGSPISPLFCNLYLNELDKYLESNKFHFVRFADDIRIATNSMKNATEIYTEVKNFLSETLKLTVNEKKSKIDVIDKTQFLGYSFNRTEISGLYETKYIRKSKKYNYYSNWKESSLEKVGDEYHILSDGILTQSDYTILFENEDKKVSIPVDNIRQINAYSDIMFSKGFFDFANDKKLVVAFYNKYAAYIGSFIPGDILSTKSLAPEQLKAYVNDETRLKLAKTFAMTAGYNLRENLKYYIKKEEKKDITEAIVKMTKLIEKENVCMEYTNLLCLEGQVRSTYYSCLNTIITATGFEYTKRTKRPPEDPLNALISFGNTLLYRYVAREIYKSELDIKIGYLHATNKRLESLNLDISEIFRPIIVDKVIFSLVNRGELKVNMHFDYYDDNKVYLNNEGKKIFIKAFELKLATKVKIKDRYYTYSNLILYEIRKLTRYFKDHIEYKAYRYFL